MITFIGVVLILTALVMLVLYPLLPKEDVFEQRPSRNHPGQTRSVKVKSKAPAILLAFNKRLTLFIGGAGLFIALIPAIFFYAEPGVLYAVQYIWGGENAVTEQGISIKCGRLIPIAAEIPINDVLEKDKDNGNQSKYSYVLPAVEREFNDGVKGFVSNSVVIKVDYSNKEKFLEVAKNNRSQDNLVFSRIVSYRDAVLKNTAKLMSAQEYISGGSSEFDRAYKDQLQNGMYVLEEVYQEQRGDTIGVSRVRIVGASSDDTQRKVYKIKYENGEPLRNEGSLKSYGLTVDHAVVNKVDWEDSFDTRLDDMKKIVAETQTQKITAEKEMYRKQAVIEKGEADKAEEQAKLDKQQIQETMVAETALKKEKLFLQTASVELEKAVIAVKTRKLLADVKKYEIDKADGLSEREKYLIDQNLKRSGIVSENLSKTNFPNFMITNGGGNGAGATSANSPFLYDMLGAKLAETMFLPLDKK